MKTTHIVAILDRSGSMGVLAPEVIGQFNHFIEEQRKEPGKAKVTVVLFDNVVETLWDEVPLDEVEELTPELYFARGMTALHDAIGMTLQRFADKKRVVVLVNTDGQENGSKEFSHEQVAKRVKELDERDGWTFMFVGAGIEASVGHNLGIVNSLGVERNAGGIITGYTAMSREVSLSRSLSDKD